MDFRTEVKEWLATHVPAPLPSMDTEEGFAAHRAWEKELAKARLSVVSWPKEYGGRDLPLTDWLTFEEEYHRAGAPARVSQNGIFLLAPTLFTHGTPAQRARLLPRMADGTDIWAQAWSEPEAGSDLANIRATAVPVPGGWRLNGQKTWSSRAAFADRGFGLFRTDPGRHGLTYFLFGLRADGVTVRPIAQWDGEPAFAEIFLDDVFVPEEDVVGEPGGGWQVAMSTASSERGVSLRSPGRFLAAAHRLVHLWAETRDPKLADRVADAWIAARAYQACAEDEPPPSVLKVFWSELDLALHETALDLLGTSAELTGPWLDGYVFALAGPIYAGTNEIQRNVIAQRVLGLPR